LPTTATKNGYTFTGWYDGDSKVGPTYTVIEDKTLTAHWVVNQYTITFDVDG
jgi:uncharacterized repeat protein (TIGR02543 family)